MRLAAERANRRPEMRQQVEVCFAALKRVFDLGGTLAKTLVRLAARVGAGGNSLHLRLYVNRLLGRPQGRIKKLWGDILATLI